LDAKVLEIFQSVQGEGKYAGCSQVFVRFFECNMHCVWCDTPHSIGDGKREFTVMTTAAIIKEMQRIRRSASSVSITGGEPLLQADALVELLPRLKKLKWQVYLDTNGTLPDALAKVIKDVDVVAMDIKLPSSTGEKAYWKEHEAFLKIARRKDVFIKNVVSLKTKPEEILHAAKLVAAVDPAITFYLQPNFLDMKKGVIDICLQAQEHCAKYLSDVRILPQTHKFMKLR